ncbi:hypothetical protein AEGHOMDF_6050 [Methylobacterium soli]|nr:hypothetical protein AEGHOMDF_6050 [Methylobacterium soli]
MEPQRLRIEAAGGLDAGPEAAHGAELRDGQELVGIGDEQDADGVTGPGEVVAAGLQGAQIRHRGGEHGRELGRLAGAGRVIGAPIRQERAPGEAHRVEFRQGPGEPRGDLVPDRAEAPGRRERADRIDAEIDLELGEAVAPALDQRLEQGGGLQAPAAGIEAQGDQGQHHAGERRVEFLGGSRRQPVAASRGGAGEDEGQRVCAAFEVGQSQGGGGDGVRMVDALADPPGPGRAHRLRYRIGRLVERLDADAVGGLGDETLLEIGALEDAVDEPAPALARGGLEEVGKRSVFHRAGLDSGGLPISAEALARCRRRGNRLKSRDARSVPGRLALSRR